LDNLGSRGIWSEGKDAGPPGFRREIYRFTAERPSHSTAFFTGNKACTLLFQSSLNARELCCVEDFACGGSRRAERDTVCGNKLSD